MVLYLNSLDLSLSEERQDIPESDRFYTRTLQDLKSHPVFYSKSKQKSNLEASVATLEKERKGLHHRMVACPN